MVLLQFSVNASGKGSGKGPMVRDGGKEHNAATNVVLVKRIPHLCYNNCVGNRKGSGHSTGGSNYTSVLSSLSFTLLSVIHPIL